MKRIFWPLAIIASLLLASCGGQTKGNASKADTVALAPCPRFCADSAMLYINKQCKFGPRVTGSEAARLCGDYLVERFKALGAEVEEQTDMSPFGTARSSLPATSSPASIPAIPTASCFALIGTAALGPTMMRTRRTTIRQSSLPTMAQAVWLSYLKYVGLCKNSPWRLA